MSKYPIFAVKPTLFGQRATLRPFTAADIDRMGPILADPDVLRLTGSVPTSEEAERRSVQLDGATRRWYETRADQADRLDLAVADAETGTCVGEVVLNELDGADASCNFRILIGPGGRGRGIGTEATRMILDHAFGTTGLNRIALEVYAFNPRARHVYERCGFVVEGRKREALRFDAGYVDAIVMSVLRADRTR
jgi:RimJ/RimL family protein N-acetyltransferase